MEDGIEKAGWGSAQEIHPKGNGKGRTGQRGKQTHSEDAAEASANPMGGGAGALIRAIPNRSKGPCNVPLASPALDCPQARQFSSEGGREE